MRIVHVVEPFSSGISTFILQLVTQMPDDEHIIVHGVRDDEKLVKAIQSGFPWNATFIKWSEARREISLRGDLRAYRELKKLLRTLDPTILHLHSSKAGVLGRLAAKMLGYRRVVYTSNAVSFLRTDVGKIHRLIYKLLEKVMSWFPGIIISSSDGELAAMKSLGITSTLIHNGVDFSAYAYKPQPALKIVTCGRVTIQKNPKQFNSIAKAFLHRPDISFVWIGTGELISLLDSENIRVTGWLKPEDVREEMASSALYISTSYWEGLSLASLEALSIGLPMLLSNSCGNPDLIDGNGSLFDSTEEAVASLSDMIDRQSTLLEQSVASRAHYENNFTGTMCGERYKAIYSKITRNYAR